MKPSFAHLPLVITVAALSACATLPPPSMPAPKNPAGTSERLTFVGGRSDAERLAVATLKSFDLSIDEVDTNAGFVGASTGMSPRGLGEKIGIYFREAGDGSMQMWVVAVRKSKTNPRPPDSEGPIRRELAKRIAAFRDSESTEAVGATGSAGGSAGLAPTTVNQKGEDVFAGEFTGTCFVAGPNGEVISTHRAVAGATALRVHLADGRVLAARVERVAPALDLALLTVAAPTPRFLSPMDHIDVKKGKPVFSVAPSPAWPRLGRRSADTDEGTILRTMIPDGEHSRFETTIATSSSGYGSPVLDRNGRVIGVIAPVPPSVRVLQAQGDLNPDHSWAVNLAYAQSMFPAVPATRPTGVNEAVDRAEAALCRVEAQFR